MTSTRLLARNTALNLLGQVGPLLLAVVAVPVLITALGTARFGLLTLIWLVIGYFSLFDFGLGRALTQAASEALGRKDPARLHSVSFATLIAMCGLGVAGAAVLAALTPWLAHSFLKMDAALRPEAERSFYLLALSLPFMLATMGFRGLFEAHQHFGIATALRLPFALFTFLGPLAVIPFSRDLSVIAAVLVFGRVATCFAHVYFGLRRYPWLGKVPSTGLAGVIPLIRMGGWMTVSNTVGPLMSHLDRFVIGAMLSMTAVTYYVTPLELVTKLLFIPIAVIGAFFPAFAATHRTDQERTAVNFDRAARFLLLTMFPATLFVVTFAREGLLLWIGPDFAHESTVILQVLAAGVLISSIGQLSFGFLQATGRPDVTAKLHLMELPIYVAMILVLARTFGLVGFAIAWTLRIAIDTACLCWFSQRKLPQATAILQRSSIWLVAMIGCFALIGATTNPFGRMILGSAIVVVFVPVAWSAMLSSAERAMVRDAIRRRPDSTTAVESGS